MSDQDHIAIIGAGIGGLTLALALHRQQLACEIYELREPSYSRIGGAVMMSPNALRVLDTLGIYELIKPHGFSFETLAFMTDKHEPTGHYYFGSKDKYGYAGLRLYRKQLVEILTEEVGKRGIPIHYGRKFSRVVSEDDVQVTFTFANGEQCTASRLIGADGTHSKVRNYLTPDMQSTFSGALGVTTAIPYSKLRLPFPGYPMPASVAGGHGAIVLAPQDPKGTEVFFGRQFFGVAERGREGWDDLLENQTELLDMISANKRGWSELVQSAMEATQKGNINVWPFYTLPKLDTWSSAKGRVVIMGDASHSVPPTAGQGANQALEDAITLAWLLAHYPNGDPQSFKKWHEYRQSRMARVMDLNEHMGKMRLPLQEQEKLKNFGPDFGVAESMRWLFDPDLEQEMKAVFQDEAKHCPVKHWLKR